MRAPKRPKCLSSIWSQGQRLEVIQVFSKNWKMYQVYRAKGVPREKDYCFYPQKEDPASETGE